MAERKEQIARFIQRSPALWPVAVSPHTVPPPWRQPYPSAETIAKDLLADSEFQALRLATWLRSPDGELIAEAVALVISPAARPEFELAVDALQLAAGMQYERGWPQRAAGLVALAAVSLYGLRAIAPAARPTG
jgi:hypothetical protein